MVAQAYYGGVPGPIWDERRYRLDDELRGVVVEFERRFMGTSQPSTGNNSVKFALCRRNNRFRRSGAIT